MPKHLTTAQTEALRTTETYPWKRFDALDDRRLLSLRVRTATINVLVRLGLVELVELVDGEGEVTTSVHCLTRAGELIAAPLQRGDRVRLDSIAPAIEFAAKEAKEAAPVETVTEPRPAREILAADPIPAGTSVLNGMPGREITREALRYPRDVFTHDEYIVQLRNSGTWILPNHDDPAEMLRGQVANALRRILDGAPGHARTSLDADGTVYASNGRQAARYIPLKRFARYTLGHCPGCNTSYATNGDGPCPKGDAAEPVTITYAAYAKPKTWRSDIGQHTATGDVVVTCAEHGEVIRFMATNYMDASTPGSHTNARLWKSNHLRDEHGQH